MKNILLLLSIVTGIAVAQAQEPLSIGESVMGAYGAFYPANVSNLKWLKGEHAYVYTDEKDGVAHLIKFDVDHDKSSTIIDAAELSKLLVAQGSIALTDINPIEWLSDGTMVFFNDGGFWSFDIKNKVVSRLSTIDLDGANHDPSVSYKKVAFTKENNLYYTDEEANQITVTNNSNEDVVSGQAIHRYEFGIAKGIFWSPKENLLAFYEKDESMVTDYPLLDYTTDPASPAPKKYPMAGQSSHQAKVGVYDCKSKVLRYLDTGTLDDHYLTNLTWSPDEKYIYLAEINRDQNHMRLNKYDAVSGVLLATILEEKDNEYVEPEHGPYFLGDSKGDFLWFSERDGYSHLYRYDASGKLKNQVTNGKIVIDKILDYQSSTGQLLVSGTRKPTEVVTYQINVDGGQMKALTTEHGRHSVQVSSDGDYIIDNLMSTDVPRRVMVKDTDGEIVKNIMTAENPLADRAIGTTELLTIPSADGKDLWCRMIKPSSFDPSKQYPVLVYVYGGPHAQMVTDSWLGGASLWMHYMTEQGYIIFTLDNRGSSNRGIEFEQKVFRNIGSQELKDQLTGVAYLKSLDYVDADRMAIHGWSFGGFMTTSMMTRYPEVFKVGVAGGPVIDWSLYEVMYTERYMDTPQTNPEGFEESNVSHYVSDLVGDLLLIHGTSDDVVVMQNSMEFLKACIEEGKQVDFFVYPGHAHNVRGKDRVHLMTKVLNYIEDKLGTK